MIVTVFGDIHGNLVALEEFFRLEKSKTDLFICHGDVVNYGPWSNECIAFLTEIKNCKLLKGNHEDYFINGSYDGENIIAKSFFDFCYESFDKNLIQVLEEYGEQILLENYIIKHTIGNQYIFEDTNISTLEINSDYIIGHSHQEFKRECNKFKIFNTGSLGQNRRFINRSCYIQFDTDTKKIELKSFIHNIDKVINQMKHNNYPQICIDYYLGKQQIGN